MAKIQCGRCDRRYSSLRLKCPYCGAHRSKKTIRREQNDVSGTKFLIGGLALLLLIAAVVVVVVISLRNGEPLEEPTTEAETQQTEYVQDEGVVSVEGNSAEKTDTKQAEEAAEQLAQIVSVNITQDGQVIEDTTMQAGTTEEFSYVTNPAATDELAIWTSDDESVAVVLQNGQVTAVGEGTTNINVKVGGQKGIMIVRVVE
jgi:predicted  nucleic acid-binding Zn-ribbon protein